MNYMVSQQTISTTIYYDSLFSSNYKDFSKTFLGDDRESWMWSSSGSAMSPETGSWQGCQHEKNLAPSWARAGGKFGTPLSSVRSQLCMHRKGFAGTQVLFFLSSLLVNPLSLCPLCLLSLFLCFLFVC